MRTGLSLVILCAAAILPACSSKKTDNQQIISAQQDKALQSLEDSLRSMAAAYPGEIGVALITDRGGTLTVNNEDKYPLMSVFKLHQAISICRLFEKEGRSLDTVVSIDRASLNPQTWSPMLKEIPGDPIKISIKDLLRYTLTQSDNNASNWLFENVEGVEQTDSLIATIIPRESFSLSVTEAEMWDNHELSYDNHSSPLGAALLIDRLFNDSITGKENAGFIRTTLQECKTGTDRIAAPFVGRENVAIGHKTGSGFRNEAGILSAHNDVAHIILPSRRSYSLAVLVKDFNGSEVEAASAIARISSAVYQAMEKQDRQ